MNTLYTQKGEEDTVDTRRAASLTTIAALQQCSLDRDECILNSNIRKRAHATENDPMCEESNGDDLNDQASDDGGSDDEGSDDGRWYTRTTNQHASISKRRCTGNDTEDTGLSKVVNFARTLDANAIDLKIADGCFVKVSKAILMQLPYFNAFFSKTWEQPTYSLSEDHPFALRIVLAILHHKPELLPSRITFHVLAQLATVCDKYDTAELVSPYVESRNWMNTLWKTDKASVRMWATWLCVAHIFRTKNDKEKGNRICGKVMDVLAANIRLQDGKWCLEQGGFALEVWIVPCPSGLYPLHKTLCKRRETLWDAFLDDCRMQQDIAMSQIRPDYRSIGEQAVLRYQIREGLLLTESIGEKLAKSRGGLGRESGAILDLWIKRLAFVQ